MAALSLADLHHLEAADGWLERKEWANCFDELECIDYDNRGDARELALRWKLYNKSNQHVQIRRSAFNDAGSTSLTGYLWRSTSLRKLGLLGL